MSSDHEKMVDSAADAELVEQLRAGMRQRRAEVAAESAARGGSSLYDLERTQYLEEPVPVSARPLLAPLIVLTRKIVRSLFMRWYVRPLMQQQNSFNRAVSLRIQELVDANRSLRREVGELRSALERGQDDDGR